MRFSTSSLFLATMSLAKAVVVTEVDYVTQYAYENIEVYVDSNGKPYSTSTNVFSTALVSASPSGASSSPAKDSSAQGVVQSTVSVTSQPTPTPAAASPSSTSPGSPPPAQSHSHSPAYNYNYITSSSRSSSPAPAPPAPAASTVTTSPEAYSPPPQAPTTSSSSAPAPPPAPPSSSTTPQSPSPPPSQTPPSSSPSPSSSSAPSGSGSFSGDATYYDVGLGACGVTNTDSEYIAALNWQQWNGFGSMSNGNPVCGKKATLHYQGKSVTVTIQDKCPGCKYGDLDLSPAAFKQLADEGAGRIQVTWSFD